MKFKNILINSMLILTIFISSSTYAENEIAVSCSKFNPIENFEILLQKYFDSNQIKKESLLRKITRITGRETLFLVLPFLIFAFDVSLVSSMMEFEENWDSKKTIPEKFAYTTKTIYENVKDIPNKFDNSGYYAVIFKALGFATLTYLLLRSSYAIAKIGTSPKQTPNLNLLTEIIKMWEFYKVHIPEELHQTLDLLHAQYLKNKKLNMDEVTAQNIIKEILKISLNRIKENSTAVTA